MKLRPSVTLVARQHGLQCDAESIMDAWPAASWLELAAGCHPILSNTTGGGGEWCQALWQAPLAGQFMRPPEMADAASSKDGTQTAPICWDFTMAFNPHEAGLP